MSSPDDRLLASVAGLTSARVSDSLDRLGRRSQVLGRQVRSLRPGMRAVGRAITVTFEPVSESTTSDPDDPYGAMIDLIDAVHPGDVVVIAAGGDDRTAYWGQLFSAAAAGHGAVGVVCDGYVRDSVEIESLGFPTFCRGCRPLDYRDRMRVASTGRPVSCAGVTVTPGDVVIADDDGVVIVPAALDAAVAGLAVGRAGAEDAVLTELLTGASLRDVWTRHRVL